MQPGTNPDDIHTILNRFSSWSGKQSANGKGHPIADEGVREIPYEEALRKQRARPVAAEPKAEPLPSAPPETAPILVNHPQISATPAEPRGTSGSEISAARKQAAKRQPRACSAKAVAPTPVRRAKVEAAPAAIRTPKPRAAQPQEFRQVLTRSVRQKAEPAARTAERVQRVSVRLSRAEECQLQRCAAKAGITMSEYLRRRALEAMPAPRAKKGNRSAETSTGPEPVLTAPPQTKSTLGDWITLLRNRFLASPPRFAERA